MKSTEQRAPLAWCIVAFFCAILSAGLLVPVYADEAASVLMRGMFLANGWRLSILLPQCRADFLHTVPWLHYPGALVSDLVYGAASPLGVRMRGLMIGFVWLGLTAWVIHALVRPRLMGTWVLAGFVSLLGLGVLPLTLVMLRGEQMLLLLLSAFVAYPMLAGRWIDGGGRGRIALSAVLFCLLASTFFYTHPKAVFFFPVVVISAVMTFLPRSKVWCGVTSGFVLACTVQAVQFAAALTACPDAPLLSSMLASQTVALGAVFSEPRAFVLELIANLQAAPEAMLRHIVFADSYQSAWLAPAPGVETSWLAVRLNEHLGAVIQLVYWTAIVLSPLVAVYGLVRRGSSCSAWWLGSFWVGLVGHVAVFRTWNFYAPSLVVPLAAWCVVLCVATVADGWHPARPARVGWIAGVVLSPMLILFPTSATVLTMRVLPSTIDSQRSGEVGLPKQALSIPSLWYAAQRDKIREFASQCRVQGDGARRLVVDNLTFFAFEGLREPLQSDYLYKDGFGVDLRGNALPELLQRLGSRSVIAQCTMFPSVFASRMRRMGNLCCADLTQTP